MKRPSPWFERQTTEPPAQPDPLEQRAPIALIVLASLVFGYALALAVGGTVAAAIIR